MEASSFGIPALATDVGGTKEIVKNDISGYLLDSNPSPTQVSNLISKITAMPQEDYRKLCESTFRTWEDEYWSDKVYLEFVNEIINNANI